MRRVLGVTCARGGSKGVPGKNIRLINGKPLIAYTIEEALKSRLIDRYIVSTDSEEIAEVARKCGAEVPFVRPARLAQDETPTLDVLLHALRFCDGDGSGGYHAVADLRCTNPLKTVVDIDGAIRKLLTTGDTDCVVGVCKLEDHHPSRIKRIINDALVDFWPETSGNRQDLKPDAFIRNGSIYVSWATALMQGIHFMGSDKIRPWYMPPERSVNVDCELDIMLIEALLASR